ncbi:MAG TPA: SDR family oxidoreductase, partial [Candidatus Limnocylindria bacterium]|nr:SDR family oxidoreductase [Candidatus Limnocylindria bacterium]
SKYAANLFLTGRSALNPAQAEDIRKLSPHGGTVIYLQADVANREQMAAVLERVGASSGVIHGVVHCAGGADQVPLLQKTGTAFEAVLRSKIEGTLCLDALMAGQALDFAVYFSSTSAVLGDLGSCDYAVANRFQMSFAAYRAELHAAGQRTGTTTALLWPLWREGGMGFGEQTDAYLKSTGQQFLETAAGLDVFERCGGGDGVSPIVLVGEPDRITRTLAAAHRRSEASLPHPAPQPAVARVSGSESLEQQVARDLREQAGALLKISSSELDSRTNFADFGFDSISLEQWSRVLSRQYGLSVMPGDFFAHPTLEKLTRHLLQEHRAGLEAAFASDRSTAAAPTEDLSGNMPVPIAAIVAVPPPARPEPTTEPIAVIGMSGRFPQTDSVREFWQAILAGRSCITEVPSNRPNWGAPHEPAGTSPAKWGGFLTDIDRFDPAFFGIVPSDAAAIDPRQRLFLEVAWLTFEDAGYAGSRIRGSRCGVFVGVEEGEYGFLAPGAGAINGNQNATLAARIAYTLDLKGPNFALTAACASGVVALHQACLSLRAGDCSMALVGGINLLVSPLPYAGLAAAGMLSPDGRCDVYSETASGLAPGEAVAAVLLKPLSKAVADGDLIYGCIRASGVNYDGRTNGITAPDPNSQADLLKGIYESQGIRPEEIQLAMGHSVGSRLGDPIEVEGWTKAFRHFTAREEFCRLTSIKPLFGHTFAASGIVNLIAVLLSMKHGILPGLANSGSLNPYLKLAHSPFSISFGHSPWVRSAADRPRMAALTATGISGTNAHVVVEEFIDTARAVPVTGAEVSMPVPAVLVPLSARDPKTLRSYAGLVADALAEEPDISLADVAFTLQTGREAMQHRIAIMADSAESLIGRLRDIAGDREGAGIFSPPKSPTGVGGSTSQPTVDLLTSLEAADWAALGQAWVEGAEVDWSAAYRRMPRGRVLSLPGYPFDRKPFWLGLEIPKPPAVAVPTHVLASTKSPGPVLASLATGATTRAPEPVASVPRRSRQQVETVKDRLRGIMREAFQIEEDIDERRPFFEIGMTSMNAGRFVAALNDAYGLKLETADIFDTPTLQVLAERIVREAGAPVAPAGEVRPSRTRVVEPFPAVASREIAEPVGADLTSILNGVAGGTLDIEQALERLNHLPLEPDYA